MHCTEFRQHAELWMEGEQRPEALAHAEVCPACRGLIFDLQAIEQAAPQLAEGFADPPARLWGAIRSQLETEGLIRRRGWAERFWGWMPLAPRPALAGAYLCVLFAAALLVGLESDGWRNRALLPGTTQPTIAALQKNLTRAEQHTAWVMHAKNPTVMATYREGLAIVDKFIALCEKTVREDPQSELAREYLNHAYQQKAELLATMMERRALGE